MSEHGLGEGDVQMWFRSLLCLRYATTPNARLSWAAAFRIRAASTGRGAAAALRCSRWILDDARWQRRLAAGRRRDRLAFWGSDGPVLGPTAAAAARLGPPAVRSAAEVSEPAQSRQVPRLHVSTAQCRVSTVKGWVHAALLHRGARKCDQMAVLPTLGCDVNRTTALHLSPPLAFNMQRVGESRVQGAAEAECCGD